MKTYKNLYSQVYDFANLSVAYRRARRGKRDRAALAGFEFDLERNLRCLQVRLKVLWA
jgi:RNA-directed DNA polymerase